MAVGRARMDGVEVHGNSQLLGMSGFEAYANSTAHRPAQFTFTSSGQSLQVDSMPTRVLALFACGVMATLIDMFPLALLSEDMSSMAGMRIGCYMNS